MRFEDLPDVITLPELAAWLRRKPGGVRKAHQEGRLPVPALSLKPLTWSKHPWRPFIEGTRRWPR